ncbi:prepilin-type N-terminal cleavage/methylation domain-containing protein [Desulfitispora alkaliphila]|uniref:PulJ/GspJ family protein n=1 Tax=Desulfitispora alkaliphila TaxID=622674 RepID=UPI003D236B88
MNNRGFTLVEILVAMTIFTMVMGLSYSFLISGPAVIGSQTEAVKFRDDVRILMNQLTKDIQEATEATINEFTLANGNVIKYEHQGDKVIRSVNNSANVLATGLEDFNISVTDGYLYKITLSSATKGETQTFKVARRIIQHDDLGNGDEQGEFVPPTDNYIDGADLGWYRGGGTSNLATNPKPEFNKKVKLSRQNLKVPGKETYLKAKSISFEEDLEIQNNNSLEVKVLENIIFKKNIEFRNNDSTLKIIAPPEFVVNIFMQKSVYNNLNKISGEYTKNKESSEKDEGYVKLTVSSNTELVFGNQ